MTDILLHCCCGPCAVACLDELTTRDLQPTAYFYNPNIHPLTEYRQRYQSWRELCAAKQIEAIGDEGYPLDAWLAAVSQNPAYRCGYCYQTRMLQSALKAKERGIPAFTTTLLISPYQKHQQIIDAAQWAAEQVGVEFYYWDFRPFFRKGQEEARRLGLYRQKYCGCIYSERDRYLT